MPLKIHATRVEAPTPEQAYGTKWQVVVTESDGTQRTYDTVRVVGETHFHALSDGDEQPRVYAQPVPSAAVHGYRRAMNALGDPTLIVEELDPR